MINNPFQIKPTRTILQWDKELAAGYSGEAKRILFQLKNIQKTSPYTQELTKRYEDGTVINVHSKVKGMDVVTIMSGRKYGEEKKKDVTVEYFDFPVPYIVITDYDTWQEFDDERHERKWLGAYVAENFVRDSEYVKRNDEFKVEYSGTDKYLTQLDIVGDHYTNIYSTVTIKYPCVEIVLETSGPRVETIDPWVADINLSVVSDYVNRCSNEPVISVYPYTPLYGVTNMNRNCVNGDSNVEFIQVQWMYPGYDADYGFDGFGASILTQTGISEWSQSAEIEIAGTPFKVSNGGGGDGFGWFRFDMSTFLFEYYSRTYENRSIIDFYDAATWDDKNNTRHYICLYNLIDSELMVDEVEGSFTGTPFQYGPINRFGYLSGCGVGSRVAEVISNKKVILNVNGTEYIIYSYSEENLSNDVDGDVEIFDYNGNPFFMYRVHYGMWTYDGDESSADLITHEIGFIYNEKRFRIKAKGALKLGIDWWGIDAFKLNGAVFVDDDGNESEITIPDKIKDFYGMTHNTGVYAPLLAGKYTIKKTIEGK